MLLISLCLLPAVALPADDAKWLRPPGLAIMTGFIHDPEDPQPIVEWQAGLGERFSAEEWVDGFIRAGASYVIFYDKWIDGLVFHDTDTTGYKTDRDLVREVADACHERGLPLVIYWNAAYDDNPEFAPWATLYPTGEPIRFPEPWPCRLLSMHSPFRQRAQEQVREILRDYGPIAGLWLDVYSQPWPTIDEYTATAFEAATGVPASEAASGQGAAFAHETLVEYLHELGDIAAESAPELLFTYNGSASVPHSTPLGAGTLCTPLGFFSAEGHALRAMYEQAAGADFLTRPMETGNLLSTTWWSPPGEDITPERVRRALAEAAVAWCQGANVYFAISPGYDGRFASETQALSELGDWLSLRRGTLADSLPLADVGIVLGAPSDSLPGLPSAAQLWPDNVHTPTAPWRMALSLKDAAMRLGYGCRTLYATGTTAQWPDDLSRFGAIVLPETAPLGDDALARLRDYAHRGGNLIVLGRGGLVRADASLREAEDGASLLGLVVQDALRVESTRPAVCYADSSYAPDWGPGNLTDGTAAAWASDGSPMPHWAQVNLPEEADVAAVRITAREGGYILTDFDVATWNSEAWEPVRSYSDYDQRVVECVVDPPRRTLGVRVTVTRELHLGQERSLADIDEIELLGTDGALLSLPPGPPYDVMARADGGPYGTLEGQAIPGPVVFASVADAQVLLAFEGPANTAGPLITARREGEGRVVWSAAPESALTQCRPLLSALLADAAGPPTVEWDGDERYLLIMREGPEGTFVAIVDTTPETAPAELDLRVNGTGLVQPFDPRETPRTRTEGTTMVITAKPDPVATFLLLRGPSIEAAL